MTGRESYALVKSALTILVVCVAATSRAASAQAQSASFTVTVVPPVHGTVQLVPALPPDGKYPAGTVVTVKSTPDRGYVLDSAWYSVPGRFGQMYYEGMRRDFAVTIDRDKRIGASFIEEAAVNHINVTHDVVYARPGVKPLKYDVYSPKGARNLPLIVIIHGGGWVANDEDIMRGLARELTRGGKFVVFSIDYRWAGKEDGDATSTTMANIIEDVFGGIAHVMEHAKQYGGDPTRVGVTGDSAGGHLSAAASLLPGRIGSGGFGKTPGVFEFMPSYLPKGKAPEQLVQKCCQRSRRRHRATACSGRRGSISIRIIRPRTIRGNKESRRCRTSPPRRSGRYRSSRSAAPRTASFCTTMPRSSSRRWSRPGSARNTFRWAARGTRSSTGSRTKTPRRPLPGTASTTRRR